MSLFPYKLTIKKKIHTQTIIKNNKKQTFIHKKTQIKQKKKTPKKLKNNIQQIINQFIKSPTQPNQYKTLKHNI